MFFFPFGVVHVGLTMSCFLTLFDIVRVGELIREVRLPRLGIDRHSGEDTLPSLNRRLFRQWPVIVFKYLPSFNREYSIIVQVP